MNHNIKKDSKFLKITTGVLTTTLVFGLSNSYFNSIKQNPNTYSFASVPAPFSTTGVIASGNCGEEGDESEVNWALTQNDGSDTYTLMISGQGKMKDYTFFLKAPWEEYKDKITKIVVEDGVTHIGCRAFLSHSALIEVEMPSVETIGEGAFFNCSALKTIELPSAETIGEFGFISCSALETVEMPQAQTIGNFAFNGCIFLETVTLPQAQTIETGAFVACKTLKTVELPNVETIGESAFFECSALATVILPKVQTIETDAFNGCKNLNKVIMPRNVELNEKDIFKDSPNVKFFDLDESI